MRIMDLTVARARALAAHPGTPLITDRTQGRVELSHATFDNWVTKTVNFLRLEAEVGEGDTISMNLPLHWMAAVWCVATWEAGCDVTFADDADLRVGGPDADIHVTADPFGMGTPPMDATAQWFFPSDVRGMPDALVLPPPAPGAMPGVTAPGLALAGTGYAERVGLQHSGRLQVHELSPTLDGLLGLIGAALAVDASVVYGPGDGEGITATAS